MSENQLIIELNQQPIELCKLLKVANLVGGGGEAKIVISEGYVYVNGEVEFQKRKKIYHDDFIEFNGDLLQVIVNEDLAETEDSSATEFATHDGDSLNADNLDADNLGNSPVHQPDQQTRQKSPKSQHNKKKKTKNKPSKQQVNEETSTQTNTPRKRRPISF